MKATNIKRKGDRSELLFYCALIALPILQVVIFYFYVNFNSVLMAFKSYDVMSDTFYWDFGANFSRFWDELTKTSILVDAFKNSFIVWLFTSVLDTFLCFSECFKHLKTFQSFVLTLLRFLLTCFMTEFV